MESLREGIELREEIDRLIAEEQAGAAAQTLATLWSEEGGPSAAAFVVSRFESLRGKTPLVPYRLAILRSFTVEPVVPLVRAAAFAAGIDLTVQLGGFNNWALEMLEQSSALYDFAPQAIILAVHDGTPDDFRDCLRALRTHSNAEVVIHTMESPLTPSRGILDAQIEGSQWEAVQQTNLELRRVAREYRGVYILDYDALVARHGREAWHDGRKWLVMRMPIAASHLGDLAKEWMRFLQPLAGKVAKVLVVDLDNTLWGGVVGEDGIEGIALGMEYPGAAYQAVQRVLLDLYHRGILLAVCSRNNPDEAMKVLESHPGMLLSPRHFAARRINWADKAQNLAEIAAELNVGLDAVAFLDDDPAERHRMRREQPEVAVIELPHDPMDYARTVADSPLFERLTLSQEDARRSGDYASNRDRGRLRQSCASLEDFCRYLQQEVAIAPVTPLTLSRVAQLTQKTNQFNLTTRRYSEPEIAAVASLPGWYVYSLAAKDRYGDSGLVGVAITQDNGGVCELDTFLLSCRVIGRTLETALLSYIAGEAKARGARRLEGWFLPTGKNAPAVEFYPKHGFEMVAQDQSGSRWSRDLSGAVLCPDWIRLV